MQQIKLQYIYYFTFILYFRSMLEQTEKFLFVKRRTLFNDDDDDVKIARKSFMR